MTPDLKLLDIQGLDSISIWPLALGWWILIALAVISVGAWVYTIRRREKLERKWQNQVLKELKILEESIISENSQQAATQLSALVRRLAIHRYSREECASLDGETWLKWLSERDPENFDWVRVAKSVLEAPFRPEGAAFEVNELRQTVQATRKWVQ